MLKACWDCLVGNGVLNSSEENEDGTHLNQSTENRQRTLWPEPQLPNEIMFILPRKLNSGDQMKISGSMITNPNVLAVNLLTGNNSPDYQNIACQLEAFFPSGSSNQNRMNLKIITNGSHETVNGEYQKILTTDLFTDLNFRIRFTVNVSGNYDIGHILNIYVGESFLEQIVLKHNIDDIRYISLSGDIAKVHTLDFEFA